ncbi:MAG: pyrroline-5-carboxylate reductase [Simkaniaceae bacterium]|nr:pyrroline-5-carboxylate reductase [Simkaniaceae bacterium]
MKIAVIGCGAMGSAMARHFASKGFSLLLVDNKPDHARALAQEIGAEAVSEVGEVDVVLLAVKPKDVGSVKFKGAKLIMSVLGSTTLEELKRHFPKGERVRLMPNLPVSCGEGVVGVCHDTDLSVEGKERTLHLLKGIGLILFVPESKMGAVTGVAGCGTAFICLMLEAMVDGGIRLGLKAEEALELSMKTMEGAVALIRASKESPDQVRRQVCSPGGSTIRGIVKMEESGVRSGIIQGIMATSNL